MHKWLLPCLVFVGFCGCTSDAPPTNPAALPAWLGQQIDVVQREPVTNPPVVFMSYHYRGQRVFYRPPYCCDVQGVVYTENGMKLCHPDGGFTGKGDGRCPAFAALATECAVVWRDPRAKKPGRDLCAIRDASTAPLE